MANVPFPGAPQVSPSMGSLGRQSISAEPVEFGGALASGLADIGQAEVARGDMLAKHAIHLQDLDNAAHNDQLDTKMMQGMIALGSGDNGYYTKPGQAAYEGLPSYLSDLDNLRNQIAGTAPNDDVQRLFLQSSRRMTDYEMVRASEYARTERRRWLVGSAASTAQAATDLSAAAPFDDKLAAQAEDQISRALAIKNATIDGDEDTYRQDVHNSISSMRTQRVTLMAQTDPDRAEQYYHANLDSFSAKDKVALTKYFETTMRPKVISSLVANTMAGAPKAVPADRFASALAGQEGTAPGVISSAGAVGTMQLTPPAARQAAQELGIPYDSALLAGKTPEAIAYNIKLGTQYASDMQAKFGGSTVAAAAAYNMGPTPVNDLIRQVGDPALGQISQEDFLKKLDQYKQFKGDPRSKATVGDYVRGVLTNLGAPQPGVLPTDSDPRTHMADWEKQIVASGKSMRPNDANFVPDAIAELHNRVAQLVRAHKDIQDGSFATLENALQNPQITTREELLKAYPGASRDFSNISFGAHGTIDNILKNNAMGTKVIETPESRDKVQWLDGLRLTDPAKFLGVDMTKENILPSADRKRFMTLQRKMVEGPSDTGFQRQLTQAQIWGAPKKGDDPDGYTKFAGALQDDILVFRAVHQRQPGDNDIKNITVRLLQERGMFSSPEYEKPTQGLIPSIPDAEARAIIENHVKHFGSIPNEGQIRWWYARGHGGR